jgi:hypothetical protein
VWVVESESRANCILPEAAHTWDSLGRSSQTVSFFLSRCASLSLSLSLWSTTIIIKSVLSACHLISSRLFRFPSPRFSLGPPPPPGQQHQNIELFSWFSSIKPQNWHRRQNRHFPIHISIIYPTHPRFDLWGIDSFGTFFGWLFLRAFHHFRSECRQTDRERS